VQQAISMIVANLRKVWQNCDRSTLEGPYKVPTIELLDHMRWIQAERTAFETLTRDLQIHSPSYEDIVADVQQAGSDGTLRKNSKAISPIADFLRVPNRFNRNRCLPKVINRPYRDVIENYDEVVSTLKASPYADFADTI
jgi:hypothetical protein